jgi:hypothetical protein
MFCLFYTSLFIFFLSSFIIIIISCYMDGYTDNIFYCLFRCCAVCALGYYFVQCHISWRGGYITYTYVCVFAVLQSLIIAPRTRLLSGQRTTHIFFHSYCICLTNNQSYGDFVPYISVELMNDERTRTCVTNITDLMMAYQGFNLDFFRFCLVSF